MAKITWLTLLLSFIMHKEIYAQNNLDPNSNKAAFLAFVQTQNIRFKIPKGYEEFISLERYLCGDGKFTSTLMYPLTNKDTSVVIFFAIYYPISQEEMEKKHQTSPQYNPDNRLPKTVNYLADTANFPIISINGTHLKKKSNADIGWLFKRNCNLPYSGKYFENQNVYLGKKGRGYLGVIYLFEKNKGRVIDKEIKKTMERMIYYNLETPDSNK